MVHSFKIPFIIVYVIPIIIPSTPLSPSPPPLALHMSASAFLGCAFVGYKLIDHHTCITQFMFFDLHRLAHAIKVFG